MPAAVTTEFSKDKPTTIVSIFMLIERERERDRERKRKRRKRGGRLI
jgi:hypothetical protein